MTSAATYLAVKTLTGHSIIVKPQGRPLLAVFAIELSELRTEIGAEKGTAKLKGFNSAKNQELHRMDPAEAQLPHDRGTLLSRLGPRHKTWQRMQHTCTDESSPMAMPI